MFKYFIALSLIIVWISLPIKGTEALSLFDQSGFASIGPGRTMTPIEYEMRHQAANVLLEIYGHLNTKGRFPRLTSLEERAEQEEFLVPSEWQKTAVSRDGIMMRLLMPRFDVPLSQCISSISTCSELVIDCTNAAEIATMSVMSTFFSDVRVDYIKKFCREKLKKDGPISVFRGVMHSYVYVKNISTMEINNIELGDFFYIAGHPNYLDETHLNYARGENVFCVGFKAGHPMFMGFGDFFKNGPKQIEQIQENLAQDYLKRDKNQEVDTELFEGVLQEIKQQPFFLGKLNIPAIIKRNTAPTQYGVNK